MLKEHRDDIPVAKVRARERRTEQVVAVVATALVLGLFLLTGGSLIEGIAVYAVAGAVMYWLARRTFV